ncbi:hypothetical protein JWJ90_18050 [Desulfobulbus rhabdoformis]|uniref:hypothetical protein n=1 Tax=Desulfobulbus rhabdoformis TaxID=34032 RepID=UPI0019624FC7|nr:hypothetical protein [Desulfobulbus rhabdoformis]MBM9616175.1 hypothetical protein [Desulfobulbus rhabdoformis]
MNSAAILPSQGVQVGILPKVQDREGNFGECLQGVMNGEDVSETISDQKGQNKAPEETDYRALRSQNPVLAREYSLLKIRGLSDDEVIRFQEIKEQAVGVEDAKDFLSNLSAEDQLLVQKANSYGNKLRQGEIDSMTEEGARNMLVTQDNRAYVDFNNDGIVDKGVGKMFVFPPPNAPEAVKDAWQETIDALPADERLMASSIFMLQSVQANVKSDAQGTPIGMYFPGEAGYTNIFPTELSGWSAILDQVDKELENMKAFDPTNPRLEKDLAIMETFRSNLYS